MSTSVRAHLDGHDSIRTRARELDLDTPVSVFRLTGGDGMHHQLLLSRVICAKPEDLLDGDELRIDVMVDGAFERAGRRKMKRGDTADLDWCIPFTDEVVIRLVDEDAVDATVPLLPSVDHDDVLGRHRFTGAMGPDQVEISGDGARYGLNVEVVERPGHLPSALDLLEDFRNSSAPGVWHRIDKTTTTSDEDWDWNPTTGDWDGTIRQRTLCDQVEERLVRPWRVQQGPIGLCGPAAVVFELIRTNPRRYVRMVRSLYEHGHFTLSTGKTVSASGQLRGMAPWTAEKERNDGTTFFAETPSADWIVLASLRESADIFKKRAKKQGSTNWEAAEWMHDLLGLARVEFERTDATAAWGFKAMDWDFLDELGSTITMGELGAADAIRKAVRTHNDGGSVILTINSALLDEPEWWHRVLYQLLGNVSNHLVTLVPRDAQLIDRHGDPIPVNNNISRNGTVNLTLFTWGRVQQVTCGFRDLERELFLAITGTH